MMNRNILICGYYGMENAGDELILFFLINDVKKHFPYADVTVLSGTPRRTAAAYNVRAVYRKNPLTILRELFRCNMLIMGGGGIFQDITSSLSFYYYTAIGICACLLKKKTVLYAVEIAPLKNSLHGAMVRYLIALSNLVSFRNEESLKLLKSFGCLRRDYRILPDPVMVGARVPTQRTVSNFEPRIGIVLKDVVTSEHNRNLLVSHIAPVLRYCIARRIKPVIIPFHKNEDMNISRELEERTGDAVELFSWHSAGELMHLFETFSVVLSSRLHGLILASSLGIPVIGIVPHDDSDGGKVRRFMAWVERGTCFIDNDINEHALIETLQKIMKIDRKKYNEYLTEKKETLGKQNKLFWEDMKNLYTA